LHILAFLVVGGFLVLGGLLVLGGVVVEASCWAGSLSSVGPDRYRE